MNYAASLSYIALTSFTPGPNNIMAMTNAGQHGFKKGIRFNIGVLLGLMILLSACAVFTSLLFGLVPKIEPFMLCLGAAYILWLAYTVWRDAPHEGGKGVLNTNSILTAMVLQFVNVKGILYGVTAMSTFVLPATKGGPGVLPFVLLMAVVPFVSTCCWSLFGSVFESVFNRRRKLMNGILALLLVYCALSQLSGLFK